LLATPLEFGHFSVNAVAVPVCPGGTIEIRLGPMADTFSSLNVHCVFSTKNREPLLVGEIKERFWAFMGGIAKQNEIKPLCIGGVADHVHLLLSLPTTMPVAKAMQLIKGGSSTWAHETFSPLRQFAWQSGYGAFTVSISHVAETITYIQNQVEHHRSGASRKNMSVF
jgi:putative transposase